MPPPGKLAPLGGGEADCERPAALLSCLSRRAWEVTMRGRLWLVAALFVGSPLAMAFAASTGNPVTDHLLALPEDQRIATLGKMVHHDCVGTRAFLMGLTRTGRARDTAYWSVACDNGKSYVIQINRDKKGTSFVADCRVLEGTGRECFQQF
jgi:hypothetical protein